MLKVRTNMEGDVLHIALEGMIDTKTAPQLEEAAAACVGDAAEVHFDFAGLEYMTSAGLRVLLAIRQQMDDKGGIMTLKNVSDDIMEIFDMTGFVDVLTIL